MLFFPSVLRLFLTRKCWNTPFKNKYDSYHAMHIRLKTSTSREEGTLQTSLPTATTPTKDPKHIVILHISHTTHNNSQGAVKCSGFAQEMDPSSVASTEAVTTRVTKRLPSATAADVATQGGETLQQEMLPVLSSDPQSSHTHIRGADNVNSWRLSMKFYI